MERGTSGKENNTFQIPIKALLFLKSKHQNFDWDAVSVIQALGRHQHASLLSINRSS